MWSRRIEGWIRFLLLIFILLLAYTISGQTFQRFEYVQPKMGTSVKLVFYTNNQVFADSIAQVAFQKIDTLNQILSDYLPNSEVNQLSEQAGNGKWIKLSNDLWEVLTFGQSIAKQSKGKFDMTIAPLSKLWRKAFRQQVFPKKSKIKAARKLVNYKRLELDKETQSAKLKRVGMRLDLGGIAKGYVVDKVVELLQNADIQSVLVNAGGDLRVTDAPPHQKGWKIQQNDTVLYLVQTAIATSGSTYQHLEWKGRRYSHLIHPKKGVGATNFTTISAQAKNCMLADAYASVLSVMERRKHRWFLKNRVDEIVVRYSN